MTTLNKYQLEILPAGGTDTAAIQKMSSGGAIAGAVSIPTRHIHQVIEMCHKNNSYIGRAVRVGVTCDEIDRVSGLNRRPFFSTLCLFMWSSNRLASNICY